LTNFNLGVQRPPKLAVFAFFVAVVSGACSSRPSGARTETQASVSNARYTFIDPNGRFECELPSAPTRTPSAGGSFPSKAWALKLDKENAFAIATTDYGTTPIADVERGFDGARDTILKNQNATLLKEEPAAKENLPGRSITASMPSGRTLQAHIYFRKGILYQFVAVTRSEAFAGEVNHFFDSVRFR